MVGGGKCKYLLYVASTHALAIRRRHAANIVRVLCQSEEGDHLSMRLTVHQTHELNWGAGSTPAVFRWQEGHVGMARHGYNGYNNLV